MAEPTLRRTPGYPVNAGLQTPKYAAGNENGKEACTNHVSLLLLLQALAFESRPDWMMQI